MLNRLCGHGSGRAIYLDTTINGLYLQEVLGGEIHQEEL